MPRYETNEINNWEHDHTSVGKRVVVTQGTLQNLVDKTGSVYYIGEAVMGLATSDDGWNVEKIDLSANPYVIRHAIGIWDDRVSLTYQ